MKGRRRACRRTRRSATCHSWHRAAAGSGRPRGLIRTTCLGSRGPRTWAARAKGVGGRGRAWKGVEGRGPAWKGVEVCGQIMEGPRTWARWLWKGGAVQGRAVQGRAVEGRGCGSSVLSPAVDALDEPLELHIVLVEDGEVGAVAELAVGVADRVKDLISQREQQHVRLRGQRSEDLARSGGHRAAIGRRSGGSA